MMKKNLFLALFSSFVTMASAQIVEFVNPESVFYGDIANTGEELHPGWDVVNISGADIYVGAKMEIEQQVTGATYQFCWGELCSPWITENYLSTEEILIPNGQSSNTFFAKYRHNGNAGQSVVKYCWFDANQFFTDVCYEVNYCVSAACILGLNEATTGGRIETITPNPIQSTGVINYSFTNNPTSGKMVICNSLGAVVKEIELASKNGTVIIGGSEFSDGLYFVSIEEQGQVYQTQRLMIQK
jgi:hypothetical protein